MNADFNPYPDKTTGHETISRLCSSASVCQTIRSERDIWIHVSLLFLSQGKDSGQYSLIVRYGWLCWLKNNHYKPQHGQHNA